MNPSAADSLNPNEHINCQSNPVMRIRQAPAWPDRQPAQGKHYGTQEQGQNVQPDMYSDRRARVPGIETDGDDRSRHNEEEGNGSNNAMATNEDMILR